MSDADAFLAAIRADPGDDATRLVFADWLDEHGQPDQAELLRVQCEKARLVDDADRRWQLLTRERALLAEHARRWLGPVYDWAYRWRFERGLPVVTMNAGTFLAVTVERGAAAAFREARLAHLRLTGSAEQMESLARSPLLVQLHTLDLDGNVLGDDRLARLLTSPHLHSIHTLNLANNLLSEAGLYDLLEATPPQLRWVDWRNNWLDGVNAGLFPELQPRDWPFAADLEGNRTVARHGAVPPGVVVNSLGMRFVRVPAGRDRRGNVIDPFWLGATCVTEKQYDEVRHDVTQLCEAAHPVVMVAQSEAEAFCQRLSARTSEQHAGRRYRLPSAEEWRYACAADTLTAYWFGHAAGEEDVHFSAEMAAEVGSYPPNPWGLYEMHGNVWEWVRSQDTEGNHVALGGSFASPEEECHGESERRLHADERDDDVGFRVVMEG